MWVITEYVVVLPETLVFHHANVRATNVEIRTAQDLKKKLFEWRKGKNDEEERVGKCNFDKLLVVPLIFLCVHAYMCDWCSCATEISFIS